jgi:hypothetical protein
MFVKYYINPFTLLSGTTASTINIPINMNYQMVDNADIIQTNFVNVEVANAINPILDYEKVRYTPVNMNGNLIINVNYNLSFLVNGSFPITTMYSDIGMTDTDLQTETNYFTQSYLELNFYDSDNNLTQNLVTQINIYSMLTQDDLYQQGGVLNGVHYLKGESKPANQVPVDFVLSNPLLISKAFYEGYYIYDYKNSVSIETPKNLYMNASYYNAKNGSVTKLMTDSNVYSIDTLVNKLYTKYTLYKNTNGYYYKIDNTYSTNVSYVQNQNNTNVFVNLYQIQTL